MSPGGSNNLILTGFMGTGKTAAGREVARRLGRPFVDMDALIEAREGRTVAEIFGQGEPCFRKAEAALCHELAAQTGLVIATGGGTLLDESNQSLMAASGPVVCLSAAPDEILRRLESADDRPLLEVPDRRARIVALLAERAPAYGRIALQVDTTGLSVEKVAGRILTLAAGPLPARVRPVRHPAGQYAIHLGSGLFSCSGALLRDLGFGGQVAVVTNSTVGDLYGAGLAAGLQASGLEARVCVVPDGEAYKTLDTVEAVYDCLIEMGLDRQGPVVALGGGVLGDMAGFVAATYLRGVPLVQVPTTLLSMVDSSVGGKVAVDHARGKNLIGAFKQPALVIADLDTLSTLPPAEFAGGLAEVVKAGLIGDPALFEQIEAYGPAPLPWIVERAIQVKVTVVESDPYERGRRVVLNLGHTFGHALELLSDYQLSHGAGVGIGLVAAARLSARMGLCDPALAGRIAGVLVRLGLPVTYRDHAPEQVWQAMATDKKRLAGALRFVLLRDVGDVFVTGDVTRADVLAVLEELREG